MNTRKAVVGAAAVVATAVGGLGTASTATAKPPGHERITSIEQLKTHLHHAVTVEAQTASALTCCRPAGRFDESSL